MALRSRSVICIVFALASTFAAMPLYAQTDEPVVPDRQLHREIGRLDAARLTREQDVIQVVGNTFVDEAGDNFIFRGVSIADPDKLVREDQWKRRLFLEIKRWGANTIRIPVHPRAWRERGRIEYLKLIDQAVIWANELDLYLIIDWHSIGSLASGEYQHPMYETDRLETLRFWRDIAFRYQGIPTTAVYELFNEPTTLENPWGQTHWAEWKTLNEEMIDVIYAIDDTVIPLVAGFNWAYDLTPIRTAPIDRPGIAYASHPYPQKENPQPPLKESFFALWEQKWGFASRDYPVICTELGWVRPDGYGAHIPVMNDGSYGTHIIEFMETRGISWTAWVFDPQWSPTLINNWKFAPSEQGIFFRGVLQQLAGEAPSDP